MMHRFLLLACLVFTLAWTSPTQAITVGPSKQTLIIDPGTSETATLFVLNDEDTAQEFLPLVDSFGRNPDTGDIQLSIPEPAKRWVQVEPSVLNLEPGERGEFTFTITVPESATPGAHYLSFFAREKSPEGQVSISASAGSLGYIYVSGDIQESLRVIQFESEKALSLNGKNQLTVGIENTGNIHVAPQAEISFQKPNGTLLLQETLKLQQTLLAEEQSFVSLPIEFTALNHIGKVRATVVIQYGFSDQLITEELSFWVIPWWLFSLISLGIILAVNWSIRRWLKH